MIKNIIFDLGNVLISFDTKKYVESFDIDADTAEKLSKIIFSPRWNDYDRGIIKNSDELAEIYIKENPEYEEGIRLLLNKCWVKLNTLKPDTQEYFKELKARGYGVYILSNLNYDAWEFVKQFDFYSLADGAVYSCLEGMCKPEEGLYKTLLERYDLNPDECVFMDDMPANIAAAEKLGIHGIVFTSLEETKKKLEALISS